MFSREDLAVGRSVRFVDNSMQMPRIPQRPTVRGWQGEDIQYNTLVVPRGPVKARDTAHSPRPRLTACYNFRADVVTR